MTSWVTIAFKILFDDIPVAVLLFLAWSVGREHRTRALGGAARRIRGRPAPRRSERHGRTISLSGACSGPGRVRDGARRGAFRPVRAAAGFRRSVTALRTRPQCRGRPLVTVLAAASMRSCSSCAVLFFLLAALHRHRAFSRRSRPDGVVRRLRRAALGFPSARSAATPLLVGFGGIAAVLLVFRVATDLLGGDDRGLRRRPPDGFVPLVLAASRPSARTGPLTRARAAAGRDRRFRGRRPRDRERIAYAYEDLAPHVKRIVERERVKAEIDAANRIQAALLPSRREPRVIGSASSRPPTARRRRSGATTSTSSQPAGGSSASRSATSPGHGLTSGIVMAMAKAALLVQVRLRLRAGARCWRS